MTELTGAVEMDGVLRRVNRAIAQYRYVSTKPAVAGKLRQALQVPQPNVCCGLGRGAGIGFWNDTCIFGFEHIQ